MVYNFNWNFKDLDGKEDPQANAGKVLANALANMNQGNSIQLFDWALKLWNHQDIELTQTESEVLIAMIEKTEFIIVIGKAQLINYIKEKK